MVDPLQNKTVSLYCGGFRCTFYNVLDDGSGSPITSTTKLFEAGHTYNLTIPSHLIWDSNGDTPYLGMPSTEAD